MGRNDQGGSAAAALAAASESGRQGSRRPATSRKGGFIRARERLVDWLGGPARVRVVLLLGAVLGLQSADLATIGALGAELESDLGIDHLQLGILASVASLLAAAATLPFGILADRVRRVRLLSATVVVWGVAMVASGAVTAFWQLLLARLLLGVVTAVAAPVLASLIGDLFPSEERARLYGYVLAGELAGTGFGILVAGNIAGVLSWRWAFWAMAIPAWALSWALARLLPEPARGGASRLEPGAEEVPSAEEVEEEEGDSGERPEPPGDKVAREMVRGRGVEADDELVLRADPGELSLWEAIRYVLRVRTNAMLIVSSACGYLFLLGVQTFAVVYVRKQYGLGQSAAISILALLGIGAVLGVLVGGRLADRRLRRGQLDARVVLPAVAFALAAIVALPPLAGAWPLLAAMPLFMLTTALLGATNPPLDAARLDVVPAGLWGRAEAVRNALRSLAIALAPLLFGLIASLVDGGQAEGLRIAFVVMLAPLFAAAVVLFRARRSYAPDVATALGSEEWLRGERDRLPGRQAA
jgi:MFS family permease